MNRIYKVIWSKVKHQYVVVSELAHRDGKRSSVASKSVRTLMAVLAVCGMATLDYGIQDSYAAEGAVTSAYQYVATGGASKDDATGNNGVWVDLPFGGGYWQKRPTEYYKDITVGDKKYRYVYTEANDGKAYWVREGYSINIVEQERFEGAKKNTVIQYHKEDPNADDSGLVQSFQNVDKNLGVTTAHGDTLWSTSTGVYAGAVNMPETKVTSGWSDDSQGNEFVINNGATTVNKSTFKDYFREVNYNSNTGEYMYNGNPVNMSALRVVDGQVGVFLTTPNGSKVYEGDVFGVYNEILMTGTNENGDLVSYWGAEDIDPMAPIGSMPKYLFDEKFEKIDNDLVALHKDDIEEIQVAQAGSGGTIGLARFGGLDVDGTVTVTSVSETGKDVQIQFANDKGSFKVDAGSKVEGTTGEASGDTLTGLSINGVDYKLGGGKTYTDGDGIAINNEVISVDYGNGLAIENGKLVAKAGDNVTIDENGISAKNTTLNVDASTSDPIANGYGKDYKVVDTDGNTVNISDVASATKLEEVAGEAGKHTSVFTNDDNLTVENKAQEGEAANYDVKLNQNLNVTSVNAGGTVISSSGLSVGGKTYVSSKGLNANSQKITNVAKGTEDTDAVNVAQLEKYVGDNATYTEGDGININNKVISVDAGKGLAIENGQLVAKAGDNVTIDENGISAKDTTLDVANSTSTPLGTSVDNVYGQSFVIADTAGNIITIDDIASATKLQEVDSLAVKYGTKDGEVDYSTIQLMKPYTSEGHSGGTTITNVAYADINGDGGAAVNVDLLKDTVSAAKTEMAASDQHLIENQETGSNGAYTVNDKNEVNLGVGTIDKDGNVTQTDTVTIKDVASASDLGDVTQIHDDLKNKDENGNSIDTSVVDAVNNLDDKVGDGDFSDTTYAKNETGDTSVTDAIHNLDDAINSATTIAGQHSSVSGSDNIDVKPNGTNGVGGTDYKVTLKDDLTLGQGSISIKGSEGTINATGNISAGSFSTGNITINKDNSDTINGLSNKTWDANNIVYGQAATEDQLKAATEAAVQYDRNEDGSVNKESISLGYKDEKGNQHLTQIHNVAAGSAPTDAVNFSQLSAVGDLAINNYNNIQVLNGSINKLDSRIDKVGAGAAALAALHPLDFDPDDKWDFAAGYGNYRGESAVAIGAFYRPNEDTMFSVGGTVGNDDNMVNAGVSFKIGQGNSISTSRVAMAKEIKSMRDIVAKQDAQIQKLTAMVNALVGVKSEPDTTTMFPDVPENHWAYEAVAAMAKSGLVKGYPDGEFKGDRTMTRYEFAQIVYNAIQAGAEVDARLVEEFKPELEYFHIATVAKDKDGNPTIERVRVN